MRNLFLSQKMLNSIIVFFAKIYFFPFLCLKIMNKILHCLLTFSLPKGKEILHYNDKI